MRNANLRDLLGAVGARIGRTSRESRAVREMEKPSDDPAPGFGSSGLETMEARMLLSAFTFADFADRFDLPGNLHDLQQPTGAEYQGFGYAATSLGDLNGDGFGDFAISAPGSAFGADTPVAGAVFIYSGQDGSILHTISDSFAGFGFSLADLGDVNGDGIHDLLISSPQYDHDDNGTVEQSGRVWIFSGSDVNEIAHIDGVGPSDEFGFSVATIGDLNNDGVNEFAVGAPGAGGAGEGQVVVYSGSDASVVYTFTGEAAGQRFGASVIGAGDLGAANGEAGDGVADILIGAPGSDAAPDFAGKVYLFDGAAGTMRWSVDGANAGDRFGASLGVSFVSGSQGIIYVGTPGFDATAGEDTLADAGRVYRFNQDGTPAADTPFWDGAAENAGLGTTITMLGDINGDGAGDVALGGAGATQPLIISGASQDGAQLVIPAATIDSIGNRLFALGDVDHDGSADIGSAFAAGDHFTVVSSLSLSPPSFIELGSDNLVYLFSNSDTGRAFAIIDGHLMAFSMVPGLLATDHVLGVNNSGVIVVRSDVEGASGIFIVQHDGTRTLLQDSFDGAPTNPAPIYSTFEFVRIGNAGDILFTDVDSSGDQGAVTRSWLLHNATLSYLWNGLVRDVNADGAVLGIRQNSDGDVIVLRAADGTEQTVSLADAWRVNDSGLVVGVNAAGNLATWQDGNETEIGALQLPAGAASAEWIVVGLNNDGQVLAHYRTSTGGESPEFTTTNYLFTPADGLQRLSDVTFDVDAGENIYQDATLLGADGTVISSSGFYSPIDNSAPWVGQDGTPLLASSGGNALVIAGVNQFGDAVLLRRDGDGWHGWRLNVAGLESFDSFTITNVLTYTDAENGWNYVFLLTDHGDFVGVRTDDTSATAPLDTQALSGGEGSTQIVDHATVFASADHRVHLAGTDANGDLVIWFQTDPSQATGFFYDNLTRVHILGQEHEFNAVASNLTTLVTQWGASHLFYLNADGALISVWIAQGMTYWQSTNISENLLQGSIASDPSLALTGEITAYGTPWGGLNVAAAGMNGDPTAIWWVPGFEGTWRRDTLYDSASPMSIGFNPDSTVAYTTPWGGLNVASILDDGDIAVFWWVPGFDGWTGEVLNIAERPEGLTFSGDITATVLGDNLNLFARGNDGDLYHMFWNPGDGPAWSIENVTEGAA